MARIPGKAERAVIRAFTYSEAGGSWIGSIELLVSVIFGVRMGIEAGIMFYIVFRIIRCFVGWIDLHKAGWIAYRADWYGSIAPGRTRLVQEAKARRRRT